MFFLNDLPQIKYQMYNRKQIFEMLRTSRVSKDQWLRDNVARLREMEECLEINDLKLNIWNLMKVNTACFYLALP